MATIRPITVYGEPVLHTRAAEVEVIDDDIRTLIEDMYVTQEAANGVGLAAPQVGVGLRIYTWSFPDSGTVPNVGHVINPVLTYLSKVPQEAPDKHEHTEGCLSAPGLGYPLQRSDHVRVTGQDVTGAALDFEATGWFARVMQHEYDHLNGTLYVNRLEGPWARKWKRAQRQLKMNQPGVTWLPGADEDPFRHDEDDRELHEQDHEAVAEDPAQ